MKMKKRCHVILFCAVAALLSGCAAGEKSPYPEVSEYLENRYNQKFELEEISGEASAYYKAIPKENPELEFKVFPVGPEYTNKGFDDTYPTVFVLNEAKKLGLPLEPGTTEKELVAAIDGYAGIEALSRTLSELAAAYAEAGLPAEFTLGTVSNGWNCADIRVELRTPDLKGYEPAVIHIPDDRQIANRHINDSDQIARRIGDDYVACICQYYLGDPLDYLTQDAVTAFYTDTDGLTVETDDGATEYPQLSTKLHFAELYRLSEDEGWNPQAAQDSFSITSNEQTSWFFLEFEEETNERGRTETVARVYWAESETGDRQPACGEYDTPDIIDRELIEARTGCRLSRGLLLQAEETRRAGNREELESYLSDARPIGDSTEIGNWTITVTAATEVGKITSGSMYFEPDEGKSFFRIDMDITNHGTKDSDFLPMVIMSDELMVELAISSGLQYAPVSLLGGGDLTGSTLAPGETKSGFIVFQTSQSLMETEDHILLLLRIGIETRAVLIKN